MRSKRRHWSSAVICMPQRFRNAASPPASVIPVNQARRAGPGSAAGLPMLALSAASAQRSSEGAAVGICRWQISSTVRSSLSSSSASCKRRLSAAWFGQPEFSAMNAAISAARAAPGVSTR